MEAGLYEKCKRVVACVNKCLGCAKDDDSKAFFYKMMGDYYRYVSALPSTNPFSTTR